jgi:hypothetical protein
MYSVNQLVNSAILGVAQELCGGLHQQVSDSIQYSLLAFAALQSSWL